MAYEATSSSGGATVEKGAQRSARFALIRDLFIFWFVIFLGVVCWRNNLLLAAILIVAYGVRYYLWPNREDHILFAGGAVLGPIAEIIATTVGIWQYTLPTFLRIPLWLPFAWGFATVLIIRIAQGFAKR